MSIIIWDAIFSKKKFGENSKGKMSIYFGMLNQFFNITLASCVKLKSSEIEAATGSDEGRES